MTTRPIDIINKIMLLHSHPPAAMIRPLIIQTAWATYCRLNTCVRWLISDDSDKMSGNAYKWYALSKRNRHKHQVKNINDVRSF